MERRGVKRSADVGMPRAGSDCSPLEEKREQSKPGAQEVSPTTIEISDEDYQTLHLPCDTLEESGGGDPGR